MKLSQIVSNIQLSCIKKIDLILEILKISFSNFSLENPWGFCFIIFEIFFQNQFCLLKNFVSNSVHSKYYIKSHQGKVCQIFKMSFSQKIHQKC